LCPRGIIIAVLSFLELRRHRVPVAMLLYGPLKFIRRNTAAS
jgi:hypothetical protein